MRSVGLGFSLTLLGATLAQGQQFYTPAVTEKPMAGQYSTGWHYGRVTFKVISYTGVEQVHRKSARSGTTCCLKKLSEVNSPAVRS
ncbi:hypothetical protein ACVIQT_005862 [Bradyrhizobium diazoefficiens]